ncbi:MAG: hypothetical protein Kow0077_17800 [Anaerolineae bacterium]
MTSHRLRVLVVEDDPGRRTALVENLRQHDYEIYVATGEDLVTVAKQQLMTHFCHVVVLGANLIGEALLENPGGTDLEKEFHPAGVVIYTVENNDRVAYLAGWHRMGYVRYRDPVARLAAAVRQQADQRQVQVFWPREDFNMEIASTLKMAADGLAKQDLIDLLGRLFPRASSVELKLMPALNDAHEDQAATPVRRAVVLLTQEHRPYTNYFAPKVTKISTRERIEREVSNYTRFVEGQLKQNRLARLDAHAILWHVGAIAYEFLGVAIDDIKPFRQYFHQESAEAILQVLNRLFLNICETWYTTERQQTENDNLYAYYNAPLDIDTHLKRLDLASPRLEFPEVNGLLPNPAVWVTSTGRDLTHTTLTTCIAHGDLHADNFFVDSSHMPWLIDFEHTGRTHALRDFVELEADIKLRITQYPNDGTDGLLALERSLLQARSLDDMIVPQAEVLAHPALLKSLHVIAGLRHLAHQATGITSIEEYHQALLYETLFMATLKRTRESVRNRALLSAALIADRLSGRTGLLSRFGSVPRLNTDLLKEQPAAEGIQIIERQLQYVAECYQCANLQKRQYRNGAIPSPLVQGLAALDEEGRRLNQLRAGLSPGAEKQRTS